MSAASRSLLAYYYYDFDAFLIRAAVWDFAIRDASVEHLDRGLHLVVPGRPSRCSR